MDGNADGPGLVGNGPGNGLADPPGGVGGELVALGVVELFHGLNEAQVALLDQVQEQHPTAYIAFRNGNYQTEVGFRQLLLGGLTGAVLLAQGSLQGGVDLRTLFPLAAELRQLLGRLVPGGHGLGQADLLLRRQQGHLADLL